MMNRLRRLRALCVMDFRRTMRNPIVITVALSAPAFLLLLFGYGVSLDTERVPVAIVIEQPTPEARDLSGSFQNARYFRSIFFNDRRAAERALLGGEVNGIVVITGDFTRTALGNGGAPVQIIVDGVDARTGRTVVSYVEGAVTNWLVQRTQSGRSGIADPMRIRPRIWFNAEIKSRNFLVPGVIALLMTIVGPLLSALAVARDWERGTMEALLATPMTMTELLVAKIVVFLAFGVASMALTLSLAVYVLEVPFRGSLSPVVAAASLFMLSALGIGLAISCFARTRLRAAQLTLALGYLPAYMLSGFIFDLRSMPEPVQWLSHLISARYFVSILHTVMLAGDVWPVIVPNLLGMAAISLLALGAAALGVRKRLA